jgi:hypothetical protein
VIAVRALRAAVVVGLVGFKRGVLGGTPNRKRNGKSYGIWLAWLMEFFFFDLGMFIGLRGIAWPNG